MLAPFAESAGAADEDLLRGGTGGGAALEDEDEEEDGFAVAESVGVVAGVDEDVVANATGDGAR